MHPVGETARSVKMAEDDRRSVSTGRFCSGSLALALVLVAGPLLLLLPLHLAGEPAELPPPPPPVFSPAQRRAFEEDGFVLLPDVLSADDALALAEHYDELFAGTRARMHANPLAHAHSTARAQHATRRARPLRQVPDGRVPRRVALARRDLAAHRGA